MRGTQRNQTSWRRGAGSAKHRELGTFLTEPSLHACSGRCFIRMWQHWVVDGNDAWFGGIAGGGP